MTKRTSLLLAGLRTPYGKALVLLEAPLLALGIATLGWLAVLIAPVTLYFICDDLIDRGRYVKLVQFLDQYDRRPPPKE